MPWIIGGIVVLVMGAVGAGNLDQRCKRQQEQERFRRELSRMSERLAEQERELATLRDLLGKKNSQVRTLAAEVERLRTEMGAMRRRASA